MAGTIEDKLYELVRPLVESMGIELWGIRYRGGRDSAVLQIFIESENGINADICGDVTNMLSPALDAEDIISPAYILEVSSPGLDRILFTKDQAKLYINSEVKAELRIPTEGRKKLSGVLLDVLDDSTVVIDEKISGKMEVIFSNILTLRVVPDFTNKNKK